MIAGKAKREYTLGVLRLDYTETIQSQILVCYLCPLTASYQ